MCGRYAYYATLDHAERSALAEEWFSDTHIAPDFDRLEPNYNVAPTHENPVVFEHEEKTHLSKLRWVGKVNDASLLVPMAEDAYDDLGLF